MQSTGHPAAQITTHLSRRYGYPLPPPTPSASPLGRLRRAGVRMFPLDRAVPERGAWSGDCPGCGSFRSLNVEPSGRWWTTCACSPRGGDELDLALFLRDRPHDDAPMPEESEAPHARLLDLPDEP